MKNRRTFLKILSASPLLACSSASGAPAKFGDVSGGNVGATTVGMIAVMSDAPAILARDAQGLYAMTITCTHEGCDISPAGNFLDCPCHGSRFDLNGNVIQGPAGSPLTHFAVVLDAAGNITVQGETRVDASARTPVA